MIIECLERGGEIVAAPLCSHTLLLTYVFVLLRYGNNDNYTHSSTGDIIPVDFSGSVRSDWVLGTAHMLKLGSEYM